MKIFTKIFSRLSGGDLESEKAAVPEAPDYVASEKKRAMCERLMGAHRPGGNFRSCGESRPLLSWLYARMPGAEARPKSAFAVMRKGDALQFTALDPAKDADITAPFVDSGTGKPTGTETAVFGVCFGDENAFLAHLQAAVIPECAETFVGIKATRLKLDKYGYTESPAFIAYETIESEAIVANIIKEHSRKRVDALAKALEGEELSCEDMEAIGEPDYDAIISSLAFTESPTAEDVDFGELAIARLNAERPKLGKRLPLLKKTALALARPLYAKGILLKAMYYAGLASMGEPDTSEASLLRDKIAAGAASRRASDSRVGHVLEWCFSLASSDLHSMIAVSDGKIIAERHGGNEILAFDFAKAVSERSPLMAFISYGRSGILSIEAKKLNVDRLNVMICKPSPIGAPQSCEESIAFTYPIGRLMAREDFLERRLAISRRLIENEEIADDELLLLGPCEAAHYEYAIGIMARERNMLGEAAFRFARAMSIAGLHSDSAPLDTNDARLLRYAPLGLANILTSKGKHVAALGALDVMEADAQAGNTMRMAILAEARDPRATEIIKQALDEQTTALATKSDNMAESEFHPALYGFLRCNYYCTLINDGRYREAKARLAAMHADPSPDVREFASKEAYKLAKLGLL